MNTMSDSSLRPRQTRGRHSSTRLAMVAVARHPSSCLLPLSLPVLLLLPVLASIRGGQSYAQTESARERLETQLEAFKAEASVKQQSESTGRARLQHILESLAGQQSTLATASASTGMQSIAASRNPSPSPSNYEYVPDARKQLLQIVHRGFYPAEEPLSSKTAPKWLNACTGYANRSMFSIVVRPYSHGTANHRSKRSIKFYTPLQHSKTDFDTDNFIDNTNSQLDTIEQRGTRSNYLPNNYYQDSGNQILIDGAKSASLGTRKKYLSSPTSFRWNFPQSKTQKANKYRFLVDHSSQTSSSPELLASSASRHKQAFEKLYEDLRRVAVREMSDHYEVGWKLDPSVKQCNLKRTAVDSLINKLLGELSSSLHLSTNESAQYASSLNCSAWLPSISMLFDGSGGQPTVENARRDLTNVHEIMQMHALALEQLWYDASKSKIDAIYDDYGDLYHYILKILCELEDIIRLFEQVYDDWWALAAAAEPHDASLARALRDAAGTKGPNLAQVLAERRRKELRRIVSPLADEQTSAPRFRVRESSPPDDTNTAELIVSTTTANSSRKMLFVGRALMPVDARNIENNSDDATSTKLLSRDYQILTKLTEALHYYETVLLHLFTQILVVRDLQAHALSNAGINLLGPMKG